MLPISYIGCASLEGSLSGCLRHWVLDSCLGQIFAHFNEQFLKGDSTVEAGDSVYWKEDLGRGEDEARKAEKDWSGFEGGSSMIAFGLSIFRYQDLVQDLKQYPILLKKW